MLGHKSEWLGSPLEGLCMRSTRAEVLMWILIYRCIGMKVWYKPHFCVFKGAITCGFLLRCLGVRGRVYVHKMAGFWKCFVDLILLVGSGWACLPWNVELSRELRNSTVILLSLKVSRLVGGMANDHVRNERSINCMCSRVSRHILLLPACVRPLRCIRMLWDLLVGEFRFLTRRRVCFETTTRRWKSNWSA